MLIETRADGSVWVDGRRVEVRSAATDAVLPAESAVCATPSDPPA